MAKTCGDDERGSHVYPTLFLYSYTDLSGTRVLADILGYLPALDDLLLCNVRHSLLSGLARALSRHSTRWDGIGTIIWPSIWNANIAGKLR